MPELHTALVIEGGGMRGIFTAGVCDAFLQAGFNPFDRCIGVSSGACTLASYLSGQYQRMYRLITGPMRTREFMNLRRFLSGGHFMDLDWLWEYALKHDPLDTHAAVGSPAHELLVGITDVLTAQAVYVRPVPDTLSACLLASSALPVLYRGFVSWEGRLVTDGGVADPIPVQEAYRRGARHITVIRTRPPGKGKGRYVDSFVASLLLRPYAALRARIHDLHLAYAQSMHFIQHPPAGTTIQTIDPPPTMSTSRTNNAPAAIQADYALGRTAGEEFMKSWKG